MNGTNNRTDFRTASGRPNGFSLIEIMIAIVIALFLLGAIIQFFVANKQSYRTEDALSRMQENARFALDLIARDIRMTGYVGCLRIENLATAPNVVAPDISYSKETLITGKANITVPDADFPHADANTDVLQLQMLSADSVPLDSDMTSSSGAISIANNSVGFAVGQVLGVSDCATLDLFQVDSITGSGPVSIQPNAALSKPYLEYISESGEPTNGSLLIPFEQIAYSVGPGRDNIPTLWRNDERMIEGVEDIEIRYRLDGANTYVSTPGSDPEKVVSIRIKLLLVSTGNNLTDTPQSIVWEGNAYPDPADRRIRQVVTKTIALRNRLP